MANQAVGFASLLAGGVLIASAITGDSLTAVMTGKSGGPSPLGGGGTVDPGSGNDPGSTSDPAGTSGSAAPSTGSANTTAKGTKTFDGKPVAAWIYPALVYGRANGWEGQVVSGWRSYSEQAKIWASGVRPAAKPGTSNHEQTDFPGGAVDVSDPEGLAKALKGTKWADVLLWAGTKDPPHFSHPHDGGY